MSLMITKLFLMFQSVRYHILSYCMRLPTRINANSICYNNLWIKGKCKISNEIFSYTYTI